MKKILLSIFLLSSLQEAEAAAAPEQDASNSRKRSEQEEPGARKRKYSESDVAVDEQHQMSLLEDSMAAVTFLKVEQLPPAPRKAAPCEKFNPRFNPEFNDHLTLMMAANKDFVFTDEFVDGLYVLFLRRQSHP
ncbi:MAG: hypothetical protein WCG05_05015 [Alphaproteobacteria bacterium]